jgi:hypothetical protein
MRLLCSREIRELFERGAAGIVLRRAMNRGALNGGCLMAAKAFLHAYGRGGLVRIVRLVDARKDLWVTEHYGWGVDNRIVDGLGWHQSAPLWIKAFPWETHDKAVATGYDERAFIHDDPGVVKTLAAVIVRRANGKTSDPIYLGMDDFLH